MKPTLALLLPLLAAPAFCGDDSTLVDLLPSDTQVVFGIRVRSVVDSDLARSLTAEMKGQAGDWQKLIALSGFDPLKDLDEVLVGSSGAGQKPPTLIVARGTFDVEKLAPNAQQYRGIRLVTSSNPQAPGVYGFLDSSTALAGDPDLVKAAIDHRTEPSRLDAALAAKIAEYREHYDIWAVVNRTDGLAGYAPKADSPAAILNSIDRVRFGISVKKGFELAAEVHARSERDAEQLATMLQLLDSMSKAQKPPSPGTKFAFTKDGGTLKVSLAVSEEELKKAIESQRKAGVMFGVAPALRRPGATAAVTPRRAAPAPTLPQPPTIGQPAITAPDLAQQPVAAPQAPRKPVAAGVGPNTNNTAVFTLPGQP